MAKEESIVGDHLISVELPPQGCLPVSTSDVISTESYAGAI